MIVQLRGNLIEIDGTHLVIDVGGVGYEVTVTANVLTTQVSLGALVSLHTHHVFREDAQQLFGFASRAEREMFRALVRVNGIGPKLAMALLSAYSVGALASAIASEDVRGLSKVPGIGKRTAERLVVELRDKLSSLANVATYADDHKPTRSNAVADAESALIQLGYRPAEAARAIAQVLEQSASALAPDESVENLVRLALRQLARGE